MGRRPLLHEPFARVGSERAGRGGDGESLHLYVAQGVDGDLGQLATVIQRLDRLRDFRDRARCEQCRDPGRADELPDDI